MSAAHHIVGTLQKTMFTLQIYRCCIVTTHLRLRERSLTGAAGCAPSSSTTLSVLRKCLNRKWRSSCVGWKGNWCNNSWEEEDWETENQRRREKSGQEWVSWIILWMRNKSNHCLCFFCIMSLCVSPAELTEHAALKGYTCTWCNILRKACRPLKTPS